MREAVWMKTAEEIAGIYSAFSEVEAVALGGSVSSDQADSRSDIDLYIYVQREIPPRSRAERISSRASRCEIDNRFWETGDEWIEAQSNIVVDAMYRNCRWMEEQLDRVVRRHEASIGYTTCFWANLLNSKILFDRNGWLDSLQKSMRIPFPPELRRAIVAKNYPILWNNLSSYTTQIHKAIQRKDTVSVNHRITAFLASYFDILFAINGILHPGEKRLLDTAAKNCSLQPTNFVQDVQDLIRFAGSEETLLVLDRLKSRLGQLLKQESLFP
jgi:hypothetical protein